MNTCGWKQLDCRYFATACREVVGDYLKALDLNEIRLTNGGGIVYAHADFFLEINYDTNLFPDYTICVVIGFGSGAYDSTGGFSGVPMWYIIPQGHPYRTQVHWTFRNKDELCNVLNEVKTDFFETTLVKLISNPKQLERIMVHFQSEFC